MRKKLSRFFSKITKNLSLTKREKFALVVAVLSVGFIIIQLSSINYRYQMIGVLVVFTYLFSTAALWKDLKKVEWVTLLILPVMFVAALILFYFLLPVRWLTRLPAVIIFALGLYAILLSENIFNVAAIRTIQLLRAAHSVGLLMTLFTIFLIYSLIFFLHLSFLENTILVFVLTLPLVLQILWSIKLEEKISQQIILFCFIISLVMGELSFVFSFWPISAITEALFLTTVLYTLVGITQHYLEERLFNRTITEFITVSVIVFIIVLITTYRIF